MSIVEERAALEAIVFNAKLSIDECIDQLCSAKESRLEDILHILHVLKEKNECPMNALISALRILLEKRTLVSDRIAILRLLIDSCMLIEHKSVLLHPVISSLLADHSLLPSIVSILMETSSGKEIVEFLFSLDSDSFFSEALISCARGILASRYNECARTYVRNAICHGKLSFLAAQSLSGYIDDPVGALLSLSLNGQPLIPITFTNISVNPSLLTLLLHLSLNGSINDCVTLTKNVSRSSASYELVLLLSSSTLSVRYPNDDRMQIIKCHPDLQVDVKRIVSSILKILPSEDKDMRILVDFLHILSGEPFQPIITSNSILIETAIRCLLISISNKKNVEACIKQLVAFSYIHQTIAENVVAIAEMLMDNLPELSQSILAGLASNSRSLPILRFIVFKMEKAYVSDVEQFFKLGSFLLDESNVRQSTLDLIAFKLKNDSSSYSSPLLISMCLDLWTRLVQLRYISPECIFRDIVMRNNWPQSNDPLITVAFINFCSTFSFMPLITVDNEWEFQPIVQEALSLIINHLSYEHKYLEGIGALKNTFNSKKRGVIEAVFHCLSKFDKDMMLKYMKSKNIQISGLIQVLVKYECTMATDPMCKVLAWFLSAEIDSMPRSLLLGTFGGRLHVPHVIGGIFSSILTMPNLKDINLAHFDVYPWFMKMDLVQALTLYFKKLLVDESTDSIFKKIDDLLVDKSKESVILYALSLAAFSKCSKINDNVDTEKVERLMMANDDVQFALCALNLAMTGGIAHQPPSTLPEAMAMALFGDCPSDMLSSLPKRLLMPFAYAGKCKDSSAIDILQSDDAEYHSYLLALISSSECPNDLDFKSVSKRTNTVAVKEPLDMQGSLAFFNARLFTNTPLDTSTINSLHAMPIVRQIHYASSAVVHSKEIDSVDKLIALSAKSKKLLPFVDMIVYLKYRVDSEESSTSNMEGSVERFTEDSVFKSLVGALPVLSDVSLKVLASVPVIPIIDWEEHLRPLLTNKHLPAFIIRHLFSEAGSSRRLNRSLCAITSASFEASNEAILENLEEILGMLPTDLKERCVQLLPTMSMNIKSISRAIPHIGNVETINRLLTDELNPFDSPDDELLELLKQLASLDMNLASQRWTRAVAMYEHNVNGMLLDYVNRVDCSFAPKLIAYLLQSHDDIKEIDKVINNELREQIERNL